MWNVENKICGATDIALTDMGYQQAMETGKRILEEGYGEVCTATPHCEVCPVKTWCKCK